MDKLTVKCKLGDILNITVEFDVETEIIDTMKQFNIIKSNTVNINEFGLYDPETNNFSSPDTLIMCLEEIAVNITANSWLMTIE